MLYNCKLTLSNIRYVSRVMWSNPGKGVERSPTPQCCSYRKGNFFNYGCQLYLLISIKNCYLKLELFTRDH